MELKNSVLNMKNLEQIEFSFQEFMFNPKKQEK